DVIDLDSFGSDLENKIDTQRRKMLRELRKQGKSIDRGMFDLFVGQRFDNREIVRDRIRKHLVKSKRTLSFTKNDNERARATCVGTMPTYNSFNPDLDFSQASNGSRIIKKRQENGKDPEEDPVDYPADEGDDGDDEEESSENGEDEEDDEMDVEADEEEEDHPAPADSIPFPPLPLILPPPSPILSPAPPPSPIRSLGYRAAMIR
nr:transposase, mutator type [Tanacetum cinerariifolium]